MIRIHALKVIENEHLYGPGKRLLLFLQGCSIHCNGCVNQHLWPFEGGQLISSTEILEICDKENVAGITIHGGEPLDQSKELLDLVKLIKNNGFTVVLFTGYLKKELDKTQRKIWDLSDIVVAGRFVLEKKNVYLQFRGSTNQRVYTHNGPYKNYKVEDGQTVAILTINQDGEMDINGFFTEDIKKIIDPN